MNNLSRVCHVGPFKLMAGTEDDNRSNSIKSGTGILSPLGAKSVSNIPPKFDF